jgi:dTDP-4-dehydrorhamnose reductase
MIRILVLGSDGMLGEMVYSYLKKNPALNVLGTSRKESGNKIFFDAEKDIESQLSSICPDYIINCIGIIKPFCKDDDPSGILNAIKINSVFPHHLNKYCTPRNIKIIQITTDCVFTGKKGGYDEESLHDALDVYGKTKSLGEPCGGTTLNIRCSIIGPENREAKVSLMEWFLSNPSGSVLKGFDHHTWNGITTLCFAKMCETLIVENKFNEILSKSNKVHFVPQDKVTKYELLNLFNKIFNKDYQIERVLDIGEPVDRTLSTKEDFFYFIPKKTIEEDLISLKKYMDEEKW